jgi:hypothetical protein
VLAGGLARVRELALPHAVVMSATLITTASAAARCRPRPIVKLLASGEVRRIVSKDTLCGRFLPGG